MLRSETNRRAPVTASIVAGVFAASRRSAIESQESLGLSRDDLHPPDAVGHRQQGTGEGGHPRERASRVGHGPAAERPHVVRAQIGVAHREANTLEGHAKLLGDKEA